MRGEVVNLRRALLASTAIVLASALPASAQDATWLANPGSGDFNTAANWSPATVPTGTAFFGASNTTNVPLPFSITTVGGFTFTAGAPAYTFSGNVSFTGAGIAVNGGSATITVNNTILEFSNSATAGPATIVNNGAAFFTFKDSSTAGQATISNGNTSASTTINFEDNSTAGRATINTGTSFGFTNISFGNNSTAGNATFVINQGANLVFFDNSTAASANITINRFGAVAFTGGSTAGSATISLTGGPTGGTLNFLDNSSAGNASITAGRSGSITFDKASTAANATITVNGGGLGFSGTSSGGNARLISNNGSTVNISALTSAGTTLGSIEGSGRFTLGSKMLTVGGNNLSTTYSGVFVDSFSGIGGSLVKTGTGTLTLTGTTGTYTGSTMVDAGALVVNGSIASSSGVTVNSSATLAGRGTVRNATIASGGTLFAGDGTAGTSIKLTGSLALQSGAFYMVQFDPTTSSFAKVTGAATLGGATVKANFTGGNSISKQYTILTAGSISGTFAAPQTNLTNFQTTLSYDATHAYLNLALNFAGASGFSANQQNVANALTNFFNSNGSIGLVYGALTAPGFTQAAGETATGSQQTTYNAMGQFMGVMTDPFIGGRGASGGAVSGATPYADEEPLAYADGHKRAGSARDAYAALYRKAPLAQTYDPRWSVWAAGFGGSQTTDGNTVLGSNNTTSSLFGTAVGADYRLSPNALIGFALAGGGTNFSVTGGGGGRSDLFQAGAYLRHVNGPSYISAALAYGWQDVTTDRTVTLAGIDRLRAEFNANAYSGRLEGGYRFIAPWIGGIGLTPYAAGQFTTFDLPAYAESVVSGGGAFALAYAAKSVTDARTELGLRTDKSFALANGILTLRGRAAWAHDFNPDRSVGATFLALPGASFVVNGARAASESALTTASAEMKWINGWSAAATFEAEFSSVTRSYAGKGALRYAW